MESLFLRPVKPKTITDQIFEQLRDSIFQGRLSPGEKLPPERELAAAFGVSRPSVKAAISRLVHMGLVFQRQGQGTFVRTLESRYMDNPLREALESEEMSLFDLLEVRLGLEVHTVGLAAARATDDDILGLEKSLEDMLSRKEAGRAGAGDDAAFHMAVAYASKNLAQIYLMKNFYDLLFYAISKSRFYLYEAGNLDAIGTHHGKILDAVRQRDPEAARSRMAEHIRYVMDFCKRNNL